MKTAIIAIACSLIIGGAIKWAAFDVCETIERKGIHLSIEDVWFDISMHEGTSLVVNEGGR